MVGSSLELIPLNMHQAQQYPRTGCEPATTSTKDSQDRIGGGGIGAGPEPFLLYSHTGGERTSHAHPPGPETVTSSRLDNFLPSLVQMVTDYGAPCRLIWEMWDNMDISFRAESGSSGRTRWRVRSRLKRARRSVNLLTQ